MASRDEILNNIKTTNVVPNVALPEYEGFGITYKDKFEQFKSVSKTISADAFILKNQAEVLAKTKELFPDIKHLASNISYVQDGIKSCINPNEVDDPHGLSDLDLSIVKAEFGVAENGAVWIKNLENRHRALYFIAKNTIFIVPKEKLVNNMHEAYKKVDFKDGKYGTFIAGPSSTADIEQSLVVGAHGAKSTFVFFV